MKIVLEDFAVTARHSVIDLAFKQFFFLLLVEGDLLSTEEKSRFRFFASMEMKSRLTPTGSDAKI